MPSKKSYREKLCRKVNERLSLSLAMINKTNQLTDHEIVSNQNSNQNCEEIYNSSVNNEIVSNDIVIDNNDNSDFPSNDNILLNSQGNNLKLNDYSVLNDVQRRNDNSISLPVFAQPKESLSTKLGKWCIDKNISLTSFKELLDILREEPSLTNILPADPRIILKTPRKSNSLNNSFHYFGIRNSLNSLSLKHNIIVDQNTEFCLAINIDGLPLTKSTSSSFWPILGTVKSIENLKNQVFIIALYYGNKKPKASEFLKKFVEECIELSNGIMIQSILCKFKISMLICDIPAKSHILSVKSHSGYFSCTKCCQEGDMVNNVLCFIETENYEKRTDNSFRNSLQIEHHTGETLWLQIPNFNMTDNIPLDYMHVLLLGATKRLLCDKRYGWIFGKPPHKLRASSINKINNNLQVLKKYIPCEFARKTRLINECKRYKATEFRLFLLYTGPIVLKKVIPLKEYNNFLTLSLASSILISNKYTKFENYISYAEDLMKCFIKNSIKIYGPDFISHNIHSLLYLCDCVRLFGSLDEFSAFPFENYMQKLKKNIHRHSQQLQQVVRRVSEENNFLQTIQSINDNSVMLLQNHFNGPLINNCTSPQYRKLKTINYCLNILKIADRFVELDDSTIVEIQNFASYQNEIYLIGLKYVSHKNFYSKPCFSSSFDIKVIIKYNTVLQMWKIDKIKRKLLVLSYNGQCVAFPLLHL